MKKLLFIIPMLAIVSCGSPTEKFTPEISLPAEKYSPSSDVYFGMTPAQFTQSLYYKSVTIDNQGSWSADSTAFKNGVFVLDDNLKLYTDVYFSPEKKMYRISYTCFAKDKNEQELIPQKIIDYFNKDDQNLRLMKGFDDVAIVFANCGCSFFEGIGNISFFMREIKGAYYVRADVTLI